LLKNITFVPDLSLRFFMTINSSEDKIIIDRLRRGDGLTFEALFKSHYHNLCVFAEEMVREKAAAEEIVGDFFLKFWENQNTIVIQISLKSYLYTSVYNNCLKYLEHLKVLQKYRDYSEYMLNHKDLWSPVSANYPLANLISQEIVGEIEQAIQSLPDQCREIFNLSRFEELSYDEIALKLGISISTVRTQMSRALQKLRERLKEYLPLMIGLFLMNL
jgi:RNA polymerase sigma-70 factor (family 1)